MPKLTPRDPQPPRGEGCRNKEADAGQVRRAGTALRFRRAGPVDPSHTFGQELMACPRPPSHLCSFFDADPSPKAFSRAHTPLPPMVP